MYVLVLLDYCMPEMDGPQVARQLRHTLDEHSDTGVQQPFICCVTAYTENSFKKSAMSAGMNEFLSKPVTDGDLATLIRKVLD